MKKLFNFRLLGAFGASESGAVTADALIWMPLYAFLLGLISDTSLMFGGQAQIMRAIQDVNRAYSVGAFGVAGSSTADAAAEAALYSIIGGLSSKLTVDTGLQNGSFVVTTVTIPTKDITATGMLSMFTSQTITVAAGHRTEA